VTNPPSPDAHAPAAPASQHPARSTPRRIMGIQPVLFVGMCLLAVVSLITVVLIFVGDFDSQAPRVVWTVVVFLVFTGLLALDLVLARRSATPLVIGVAANTYLLGVLMIAIWVRGGREGFDDDWLFAELFGIVLLTLLVVRAAAAGAWGLITLGRGSGTEFGRVLGLIAAALLGLVGVLLTLHFAIDAFGVDVDEWYWRSTVAAIVITALAASVTVLLYWNRRNLDWQEAEARGEHVRPAAVGGPVPPPLAQQHGSTHHAAPGHGYPGEPSVGQRGGVATSAAAAATGAPTAWPQPPAGQPAPAAPTAWPQQPGQQPGQQPAGWPAQPQQPDANGLLPWPTYADGTPYPMGPDGQPVFPPGAR
jgi:hypothetical protein